MTRDREQDQAINTQNNVVVRAGAGAGKTSVLVERYVRLVSGGVPVDQILTLTFTRKAAAEMHERIHERLVSEAAEGNLAASRELGRFDTATISTLDSFCATVARSGCTALGVPPTFSVDEGAVDRFAESQALRFLMSQFERSGRNESELPGSHAVLSMVRLNRFEPLWRSGFARLARDHFLVGRPLDLQAQVSAQHRHILGEIMVRAGEIVRHADTILGLSDDAATCVARAQDALREISFSPDLLEVMGSMPERGPLPEPVRLAIDDVLPRLDGLLAIKKNCGSSSKPDVVEFKACLDEIRGAATAVRQLLVTLRSWSEVVAAMDIAGRFQSIILAEKRRTGLLSYHDVVTLAIAILRDDPDLRRHYKARFRSIMIDEFQDNNDEQRQLLYLLAEQNGTETPGVPAAANLEPGKLFFVGDEKQSIYRFRGADVAVFKGLADDLGSTAQSITLAHNYRSEPGLIAFFNALFPRIFSNPGPRYEATFSPLVSRAGVPGLTPRVELWSLGEPTGDPDSLSTDDAEAWHVASFIRDAVDTRSLPVPVKEGDTWTTRPAEHRDFSILLRSTGNQLRFERMLRVLGVPYTSQTARSLFLEAPVNDLYSILQLVVFPDDRVALAAYLRSPLVGMSDDGLIAVLAGSTDLFSSADGLSVDDRERYKLAASRYEEICKLADSERLCGVIHHIWYVWGYRYHLLRRPENHPYLEHYDYLYELARLHEGRGLASLLRTIRASSGRNERVDELTVLGNETGGVQIMTIHKAKGLEFPVVILANAGNRGRTGSVSDAPFYESRDHGLVFNVATEGTTPTEQPVNAIYHAERDHAKLEDAAELRRVLYVAATRAIAHLVICGYRRGDDRSMLSLLLAPFLQTAEELADHPELDISTRDLPPVAADAVFRRKPASEWDLASRAALYRKRRPQLSMSGELHRRRAFTVTELNAAAPGPSATSGADVEGRSRREHRNLGDHGGSLLIDGNARAQAGVFGTYVHYCIEQLGTGRQSESALLNPLLLPPQARPDLKPAALQRFLQEGLQLAGGFLESSLWHTIRDREEVVFELPFLLRLDLPDQTPGVRVRGKMDLVAANPRKVTIVDFKTDRQLTLDHYSVQLGLYRRAATSLFSAPAEAFLFDLRNSEAIQVDDDIDDALLVPLISTLRVR